MVAGSINWVLLFCFYYNFSILVLQFVSLTLATLYLRLHLAAWAGHTEVVSYLCKQKADVGAAAMDDMGAIHFASQKGHLEVVRALVSFGASVKALTRKGLTPLHYAVQGSHLDLVKYLVKKGASLGARTKAGKTPLDLARSEEIRSFLEEWEHSSKKGNLNPKENAEGTDPKQPLLENPENSGGEVAAPGTDEKQGEASLKRKSGEHDIEEASSEPKKTKVALKHLLTADDTQEDEES